MHDGTSLIYPVGRSWQGSPHAWKNFIRSLPTHNETQGHVWTRNSHRLHMRYIHNTLKQFDAKYQPASRRHSARIVFSTEEGKCAWMLAYA